MAAEHSAETLAAIAELLRTALVTGTASATARVCLDHAERLTGSAMGWVGVLNDQKRLDTIAMGDHAWEACQMHPEGRRQITNMEIRGIWSGPLRDGTSQIVNEPAQHPFRVGVPIGHVPIESFMGVPLLDKGKPVGVIALANKPGGYEQADIERIEPLAAAMSEALLQLHFEVDHFVLDALFESSRWGQAVCDLEGIVIRANPAFAATWGRRKPTEILHWPLDDIVQLDLQGVEGGLKGLLQRRAWSMEAVATTPSGNSFPVMIEGGPIYTAGGELGAYSITTRDISEQRAAEERTWSEAEELARSNQELERFALVVARELDEPLRKILAFGEFLESDCGHQLDRTGQDYLERMLDAARRQQRTVKGLLRYARIQRSEASFVEVDLAQVARDAITDLRSLLRETGGSIQTGPGLSMRGDETLLRLLLRQLMRNGLEFHRSGVPPVVRVDMRVEGEWCVVTVEDNGKGFEPERLHEMFQVFGRLHPRHEHAGTGLGLSICQRIVELHGGTISGRSEPGRGSCFEVTLPHRQDRKPFVAPALRTGWFKRDAD